MKSKVKVTANTADNPIVDLSYTSTMSDIKIQKKFNEAYGGWICFKLKDSNSYCSNDSNYKFVEFITGSIKKGKIVVNGNMTVAELEDKYKELGITARVTKGNKFLLKGNTKIADINKPETEGIVEFNFNKDTELVYFNYDPWFKSNSFYGITKTRLYFFNKNGIVVNNSDSTLQSIYSTVKESTFSINEGTKVTEVEKLFADNGMNVKVMDKNEYACLDKNVTIAEAGSITIKNKADLFFNKNTKLFYFTRIFSNAIDADLYFFDKSGIIVNNSFSTLQSLYGTVKEGSFSINERTTVAEVEKLFADYGMNVKVMDYKGNAHLDKNVTIAEAGGITIKNKADFYYNKDTDIDYFTKIFNNVTGVNLRIFDKKGLQADYGLFIHNITGEVKEGTFSINKEMTVSEVIKLFKDKLDLNVKILDKENAGYLDNKVTMENISISKPTQLDLDLIDKSDGVLQVENPFCSVFLFNMYVCDKDKKKEYHKSMEEAGLTKPGHLTVTGDMTPEQVEKLMKDTFGLYVLFKDWYGSKVLPTEYYKKSLISLYEIKL